MYFIFCRLQRNELSAEKSQLFQNGPVLSSTPFARQSSLQQELEAQEVPVHAHACIIFYTYAESTNPGHWANIPSVSMILYVCFCFVF